LPCGRDCSTSHAGRLSTPVPGPSRCVPTDATVAAERRAHRRRHAARGRARLVREPARADALPRPVGGPGDAVRERLRSELLDAAVGRLAPDVAIPDAAPGDVVLRVPRRRRDDARARASPTWMGDGGVLGESGAAAAPRRERLRYVPGVRAVAEARDAAARPEEPPLGRSRPAGDPRAPALPLLPADGAARAVRAPGAVSRPLRGERAPRGALEPLAHAVPARRREAP